MPNRKSALHLHNTSKSNITRFEELDALRGIAATMVLLLHFGMFKYGSAGVDLFFIISGFVIFMSVERSANLKIFWRSRFVRLYPSYWLSVLVAILSRCLFYGFSLHTDFRFIIGNLTMLQPLFRTTNLVGTYWTLYVELLFYASISLIWYFEKFKNIQALIFIGLLMIVAVNGIHLIFGDRCKFYTRLFIITRAIIPLLSHLQLFSAGIIFYLCYKSGFDRPRISLLLGTLVATAISHSDSVFINHDMNICERIICNVLFYIVFIFIVKNRAKYLRFKPLALIGTISYPLYLIHLSFGLDFGNYLAPFIGKSIAMIIGMLSAFILAFALTFWFDIPIRKKLRPKASEIH